MIDTRKENTNVSPTIIHGRKNQIPLAMTYLICIYIRRQFGNPHSVKYRTGKSRDASCQKRRDARTGGVLLRVR